MSSGVVPFEYQRLDGDWAEVAGEVIEEAFVSIFVNGQELATIMSTPRDQDKLALGFLRNENIIEGLDDVRAVHICPSGSCVDVWLRHGEFKPPQRRILTSGCGGGVTFTDLAETLPPLESGVCMPAATVSALMIEMQRGGTLYARSRGVHTAGLALGAELRAVAEDVGRHNTLDKLRGDFMLRGLDPRDHILLTTGRISSEMISKAARMGCPIVASRTSPTSMSVWLAREWNITLCGYVRRGRMNVYAHPERLENNGTASNDAVAGGAAVREILVAV